ncbi:MAG: D-alanyl-D-alanine carboxypeptidase family protein [Trichodesmium sp. ALOHA_ZT_67]|nr:D-alanyl-D-alanine carboxypeptidase family protein [Trichodesmium sp. ALOHA_ZT_67]MDE5095018.1 D-alanyl-D-alanine carboxypeptidase family protein [Trichodesmium sp. St11_bin5]MDT9338882.1 D-alanyl-D-alanine carboxypeptidase family protein [Trichodesmium erythraeum 21-75]
MKILNKLGLLKKTPDEAKLPVDDIPEAVRDEEESAKHQSFKPQKIWQIWQLLAMGAIALIISISWHFQFNKTLNTSPVVQMKQKISTKAVETSPTQLETPSPSPSFNSSIKQRENILGHLPYKEASWQELTPVFGNQNIRLRSIAAEKFDLMADVAWSANIELVPLSGFRTVADQQYLFFEVKAERGQETSKRAEVSAPPGYSEHHTGYAIDIGDARMPETHLEVSFENTKAFQWLQENAENYGFELSFPKDNPQGISYEPWHWRFVGDSHSLKTFEEARSLKE